MKKIIIIFLCFACILTLVCCGKLTVEEYNTKAKEFDEIFDSMSQDFYQQSLLVIDGKKPTKNLYDLYDKDIEKMDKLIMDIDDVPNDKKVDLQNKQDLYLSILMTETDTILKEVGHKSDWERVKDYAEKRFTQSGTLDKQKELAVNSTKPPLELLDMTDTYENGISYIIGTIINNTNMKYDYVSVKINLYDKDDNLIGNTLDVASNLSPGEKWKFKASVTEKGFQKYKVTEISGN